MRFAGGWSRTIIVDRRSGRGSSSGYFRGGLWNGTMGLRKKKRKKKRKRRRRNKEKNTVVWEKAKKRSRLARGFTKASENWGFTESRGEKTVVRWEREREREKRAMEILRVPSERSEIEILRERWAKPQDFKVAGKKKKEEMESFRKPRREWKAQKYKLKTSGSN